LQGRSIEILVAGSIAIALKVHGMRRPLPKLADDLFIDRETLWKIYSLLLRSQEELNLCHVAS